MNVLDSFDLSGKLAVVTGGNRGLGEAWVQSLVGVGAAVVIAARDDDRSRETAHRIGGSVDTVHLDVRDADDVRRALATIVERHGRVDILVNNAGTCIHRPALEVSDDDWEQVIDVNLNGLWRCSQSFGRHMIENGGGVIVNIGSISAQIVNRPQMQPAYNASKAAVHQLTKSLAAEWAPYGVRVNALAPEHADATVGETLARVNGLEPFLATRVDEPILNVRPADISGQSRSRSIDELLSAAEETRTFAVGLAEEMPGSAQEFVDEGGERVAWSSHPPG